ncbi:hypothetical protein CAS74_001876 [Pichia kudriavzevii]|uniref:Integrase catalytic domain-containing protein n=1 Tax=Pichia kudriavzevii TaxID=4909 RepID=A0A1Z8JSH6_PICKU|nr:hypothetical protein CAS74_001876 [Pichia kudriavzevii]
MRAVRRNLKNVDNYPLLVFVQSVEEKENNNVLEEPYDGVDGIRKKIHEEFRDGLTNDQPTDLPPQRDLTHRLICIEPRKSTYRRQYKSSYSEKQELNKQVDELLKLAFIKSAPNGSMKMCVDYGLLNNNTVKDKFPIPRIDELITCFGGASVFSRLGLMSGYFQVRIAEDDMEKTAFSTDYGHYEWVVMSFGLTNTPSTFQRTQRLSKNTTLIAKKKKCSFYFKTLGFLGHLISSRGIQTDPAEIDKIKSWPIPKNAKDAQSFLGLADYDFTIQYLRYPDEENEVMIERIIQSYEEDNEIKEIYDILKENLSIPKSIHNHIKHYSIEDNLLYFSVVKGGNDRRIVVSPKSKLVQEIIGNAHDGNSAGHFGYFKTYMRLHPMFYWPNMLKSVKRYCQRCTVCQKTKPETTGQRGLFSPLPIPEGRWTDISLDFVTGVPRCKNGHGMILVVVDRFTKMAHFIPTRKTATAEQCAKLMVDNCFKLHGIPKRMVSDNDIEYLSGKKNRILNQLLRNYASNDLYSWDKWLSMAEFAYNSSHQVSISSSPFEVCYGYLPDSPMFISSIRVSSRRYSNKAEEFALKMKVIMENVKENMIEAQRSQEIQHNKSRVYETFEVGDWTLLHKDAYGSDRLYYKIQPVYYGPYKVVKKISDNAYEVDLPKTNKKDRVINVRWLRRFLQADKQFSKVPPRMIAEARSRLTEIIGIAGIDETNDTLDVY